MSSPVQHVDQPQPLLKPGELLLCIHRGRVGVNEESFGQTDLSVPSVIVRRGASRESTDVKFDPPGVAVVCPLSLLGDSLPESLGRGQPYIQEGRIAVNWGPSVDLAPTSVGPVRDLTRRVSSVVDSKR
jgi:hypothetical protein